jgi:hypothetical protein
LKKFKREEGGLKVKGREGYVGGRGRTLKRTKVEAHR